MNTDLIQVPFQDDTLFLIAHNEEPFAPMKPIIEGMGMGWGSQRQKLEQNKERWATVTLNVTVAKDGKNREMVCMPVRKLPAYFASIHPKRVRPEIRERVIAYQNECDDVLWKYWSEGRTVSVRAHSRRPRTPHTPESPKRQNRIDQTTVPKQPVVDEEIKGLKELVYGLFHAADDQLESDIQLVAAFAYGMLQGDPDSPIAQAAGRLVKRSAQRAH